MKNRISNLSIKNFKSIKNLDLKCKRINLFIGKPNAGKSNILEALSMYSGCYETNKERFLHSFIRFNTVHDLFHYRDLDKQVEVVSDIGFVTLRHYRGIGNFIFATGDNIKPFHENEFSEGSINDYLNKMMPQTSTKKDSALSPFLLYLTELSYTNQNDFRQQAQSPVKKYDFKKIEATNNRFSLFLLPDGSNIYQLLEMYKELSDYAGQFFEEYGMEFLMKHVEKRMAIFRKVGKVIYELGIELTPDTFQRLLYNLTAIKSNTNSVLLFEEPESHSFPPYIQEFTNQIIQSDTNQFFLTTHSPYLLNTFLQDKSIAKDLNVIVTWFDKFETKIKILSQKEISEIYGNGIDIFFNMDNYIGK